MREIGGYLELERLVHREYYPGLVALNTARNALIYLCRAKEIRKVYLPYFLCGSVAEACRREGVAVEHYAVGPDLRPRFAGSAGPGEAFYLVNYYGQLTREEIFAQGRAHGRLVLDHVQAFFAPPPEGVDTIYSCRKFFGVPDGAYLSTDVRLTGLAQDVSGSRMGHLLGRYEALRASDYYADFKENDRSFRDLPLREMSRLTHNLLGAVDYAGAKRRREENWAILAEALGGGNRLSLRCPEGPYAYPLYREGGLILKKRLAERGIFVPTLWPDVPDLPGCETERDLAENVLPLPIDQRYGPEDMKRILEELAVCSN